MFVFVYEDPKEYNAMYGYVCVSKDPTFYLGILFKPLCDHSYTGCDENEDPRKRRP